MKSLANNAESFTPEEDIIEELADGRTIQKAVKGVPMPLSEAKELGLVQESDNASNDGEKAKTPSANKAKTPTENKTGAAKDKQTDNK